MAKKPKIAVLLKMRGDFRNGLLSDITKIATGLGWREETYMSGRTPKNRAILYIRLEKTARKKDAPNDFGDICDVYHALKQAPDVITLKRIKEDALPKRARK